MQVGVDSKILVMKHGQGSTFKSVVGPVIRFEGEYEEFSKLYNEALERTFSESEYERIKETYKSYEIMQQFAEQKEELIGFLRSFFKEILDHKKISVNIVYTRFSKQALDGGRVQYYSSVNNIEKSTELNDFIDELKQYFPVVAAFKDLEEEECEVYLDNFSGEVTKAWDSLINTHDVNVLSNGDKTNKMISLSDLISKFLGIYLNRYGGSYIEDGTIKEALDTEDNIETTKVHNKDLSYVVPHRPDKISVSRYFPEPKFLILLDNGFDKQREWFEDSKYYDLVCQAAETRSSGVKFLDLDSDSTIASSGDFLVFVGEEAKKTAEQISNLDKGKPIPVDNIDDMI